MEAISMPRGIRKNVTGERFNHLLVLEEVKVNNKIYCNCRCDCGKEKLIRKYNVTSGIVKSCGCTRSLVGLKIGKLRILEETNQRNKKGRKIYLCECDCGNRKLISAASLHAGTKSCGCLIKQNKYDHLIGKKFGKLTVLKEIEKTKYSQRRYLCECDCGVKKIILGSNLLYGESTSCGCNKGYVEHTKINMIKRQEAYSNSKSGIKGVWQDKNGYWHAIITVCNKRLYFYGGKGEKGKEKCINWRTQMVDKYHKPLIEKYETI